MTEQTDPNQPVVLTTVPSLEQADAIVAALQAEGFDAFVANSNTTNLLPHMSLMINRKGIEIMVRQCDLQAASELLGSDVPEEIISEAAEQADNETDKYASAAVKSLIFSLLLSPLFILAIYFYIKAKRGNRTLPPNDVARYRKNMGLCFWGMIVLAIGCSIIALTIFENHSY